jgi:hypothetical protein
MTRSLILLALALAACAGPPPASYSQSNGPSIICMPASRFDNSGVVVCH